MSKKQLRKRLNSLFADLEQDASISPTSGERSLPGWIWECDHQGNYTFCGPEVEDILQIPVQEFINKPLASFALSPDSVQKIEVILAEGNFPVEANVSFLCPDGDPIRTRIHIYQYEEENGDHGQGDTGLRGFTAVLQPLNPPTFSQPAEAEPLEILPGDENDHEEDWPPAPGDIFSKPSQPDFEQWQIAPTPPVEPDAPPEMENLAGRELAVSATMSAGGQTRLAVPVKLEESSMGLLEIIDDSPERFWTMDERRLVEQVADQLSLALENANLWQSEQRRAEELSVLHQVSMELAQQEQDLNTILSILTRRSMDLLKSDGAGIWLYDDHTQELELVISIQSTGENFTGRRLKPGEGMVGKVYLSSQVLCVDDYLTWEGHSGKFADAPFHEALSIPLTWQTRTLGVLALTRNERGKAFLHEEQSLGMLLAGQASAVIRNAQLYQEEQRRRKIADALREIARVVGSSLDLREVSERMLDQLSTLIEYRTASIQLIQRGKRQLISGRGFEIPAPNTAASSLWRPVNDDLLITEVVQSRKPLVIPDTLDDNRWDIRPETQHVRSWVAAPLVAGQEVVGILTLDNTQPGAYTTDTAEMISAVAAQAAVAIQNARLFRQTQDTLAETESLYLASAELNTARSYDDILAVLRRHTIAGQNSHHVSLSFFDRPWSKEDTPQSINSLSRWTATPTDLPASSPVSSFSSIYKLLRADVPLLMEDITQDPRIDANTRSMYTEQFGARAALFLSIVVSGQWLGFLNANYPQNTTFSENEIRRLSALVNQAAVAIQNLRNIDLAEQRAQEAQARSQELSLINRVVSSVVSSPDLRQVLDTMAQELVSIFKLGHVGIAMLDETRQTLAVVAEKSLKEGRSSVGQIIQVKGNPSSEQVISTRQTLVVSDAMENPMMATMALQMHDRGVQSIMILPIISSGEVIGTVGLEILDTGRAFSENEVRLAETLVGQISTAVQNANLFEQIQGALSETNTMYQASAELNAIQTYGDILTILRQTTILGHPNSHHLSINLFEKPWIGDDAPDSFVSIAAWANSAYLDTSEARFSMRAWTTAKQLLRPDALVLIENTEEDARIDKTVRATYVERLSSRTLLILPLNVGGQFVGHITAGYTEPITLTEKETRRLLALSGQAAVAVQNLRLLEETRRRAAQLETAAEIARDTSGTLALDTLLRRAVNMIRDRYGYYHASIFLIDESGLNASVRESTGEAGEELKRRGHKLPVGSRSIIGYVTEMGKPLVINDVTQDPIYRPNPLLPDTRAEMGLPLKIGNRVIGALDVQSVEVNGFTSDDISIVQTLADQIAVAVENSRSYELAQQAVQETRLRVQELSTLFNVSQALAAAPLKADEISIIISRKFVDAFNISECSVDLRSSDGEELRTIVDLYRSSPESEVISNTDRIGTVFQYSQYPLLVQVMQTMQPVVVQLSDPKSDSAELAFMKANNIFTQAIVPLAVKGECIGVMRMMERRETYFTKDQLTLALTLANASAVSLENARLYEEQLKTAEQLREVDRLKSQFLANMSHELRTPLNSIIGFSRVILKGIDGPISDLQQQDLSAIHGSGTHLLALINDILDISKIEAGKMELAFDPNVNMYDLINSALSTAVGLVKDKTIKLIKNIAPDLPPVRADQTRVRQVIINLLSNASKFTDEGTVTVTAETSVSPDGLPEILVKVTDTGMGIATADQKKLFQPFSQVDDSATRKVGGTGLGLSISRRLIEMHGGRMGLWSSEIGIGTTFFFTLPLPVPEPVINADKSSRVILAVDDERPILNLYDRYLSEHGYQVVPLTDPKEVVARAKEIMPFAITLDVMMPGRNGWQVLEELKSDPETRNIPVIVCSILEDQERGFSMGASDYLSKPILEDDLVNALGRLNGDGSIKEVLVIDDDEDDLRLVEKILTRDSLYSVRMAKGGSEGLVALRMKKPQAVILDLFMPGLDGFSLLETMRADAAFRDIPVIIFTSGDLTDEQRKRLAQFSQDMLYKGVVHGEELLQSIERALKRLG